MSSRKFVCGCRSLKCNTKIMVANDVHNPEPLIFVGIGKSGIWLSLANARRLATTVLELVRELENVKAI